MLRIVRNEDAPAETTPEMEPEELGLDEICRLAARQMLASALLAERRASSVSGFSEAGPG
jgi:hypothetical protein